MKNATMKALRFGIEIETIGLDKGRAARAIQTVVGGTARQVDGTNQWQVVASDGRVWSAVPDGSLSGYHNAEIVSPILEYTNIDTLQNVVRALRAAGARVDDTCGIHVHADASRFDAKAITNLVKMVHKQERLLEHALGISANRLARFCKPIEPDFLSRLEARRAFTLQQISEAWYGRVNAHPGRYDSSRYHGLNLNSMFVRGTLEFRYFNGSLHAGEVKGYVQLVLALAAKGLTSRAASSARRDFNVATAKYDFRVFLLGLGLIGAEFKTARLHLTKRLAGSAAWKGERRDRRVQTGGAGGEPTEGASAAM